MRSFGFGFCMALMVGGAAQAGEAYTLSASETSRVESAVREKLLDPESARFEKLQAVRSGPGLITVCGLVNAKNRLGGYTGRALFHTFIAKDDRDPSKETIAPTIDQEGQPVMAGTLCQIGGISIPR